MELNGIKWKKPVFIMKMSKKVNQNYSVLKSLKVLWYFDRQLHPGVWLVPVVVPVDHHFLGEHDVE